ncbi:hypothetical protein DASC09_042710 [Saccharomycopsis crataegensis]|uniref:Uncharacterized protein n=1 Tax=Saccharomycopsis crataegensis TaxID=43959 RepID=A0AAV5QQV1_9ASCO|nr:hypothetical protein DASC09_042710 [Saccharomycopsis crataegensis]
MGLFDYFFSSSSKKPQASSTSDPSGFAKSTAEVPKYDNNGSLVFQNNKILAMNDDKEDGFIQVDFRKLSYAEVAALKSSSLGPTSEGPGSKASGGSSDKSSMAVDIDKDLGTDITDYQLAEMLQKQMNNDVIEDQILAHQAFLNQGNSIDNLNDFADAFDGKLENAKTNKSKNKTKVRRKSHGNQVKHAV